MAVYDNRICIRCKRQFRGGPRAWYCPTCREDRRRERERKYANRPSNRPLGSTDICQSCGAEYIVCSGLQKYCPDCQPIKHRELDAEQGVKYYHKHYAAEKEKRRARYAASKDEINRKRREKRAQKKKEEKS